MGRTTITNEALKYNEELFITAALTNAARYTAKKYRCLVSADQTQPVRVACQHDFTHNTQTLFYRLKRVF